MYFLHFLIYSSPYNIVLQTEVITCCVHGTVPLLALTVAPCWCLAVPLGCRAVPA